MESSTGRFVPEIDAELLGERVPHVPLGNLSESSSAEVARPGDEGDRPLTETLLFVTVPRKHSRRVTLHVRDRKVWTFNLMLSKQDG